MFKYKPVHATSRFWLRLLVSYRVEHSKRNSISIRAPFIILYLSYNYTRISSLEKAVTVHVKNIVIFHVCLISPISWWHVTRLSHHLVRLINERQSLHHSQSKVFCRNFFGLWLLKHLKICIVYRQWRSIFPRGGNTERKLKVTYLVVSRGWERK